MPLARTRTVGGYRWNDTLGRYIAPNGRIVSQDDIRRALDTAIAKSEQRARALGTAFQNGDITANEFFRDMRRTVKETHLYNAAAAKGGWAQLTDADYGRVGQRVRVEYGYLNDFARDVASGARPINGRISADAGLYAEASRGTYDRVQVADMRERGMREEANVLHPAEHCEGTGSCVGETARGYVPIGKLIPIGDRLCGRRCKCTKRFR